MNLLSLLAAELPSVAGYLACHSPSARSLHCVTKLAEYFRRFSALPGPARCTQLWTDQRVISDQEAVCVLTMKLLSKK